MKAEVCFVDVGQGDCTVAFDLDSRECVVLDCPRQAVDEVTKVLDEGGVAKPSLVVLSHSDTDHMAGAVALIRTRGAEAVRYNHDRTLPSDPEARTRWKAALRALAALEDAGVTTGPATTAESGRIGSIEYELVAPTHAMVSRAQVRSEPNHSSAVVRFVIGPVAVVVGGDADPESWRRILDSGRNIKADVFRIPHHGASLAGGVVTWDELLAAIRPQAVVISVAARNAYGHPARDTLEALQRHAIELRTLCTQINSICLGSAPIPSAEIRRLPVASQRGLGGRPGAIRCAGTVSVEITDNAWRLVPSSDDHGRVIDQLDQPMCRPAPAASASP